MVDLLPVRLDAVDAMLDEAVASVGQESTECRKLWIITGLKTLSSKLPCEPAKPMAASLPITWTATMVIASHWVGLTLPGMIEEPARFRE